MCHITASVDNGNFGPTATDVLNKIQTRLLLNKKRIQYNRGGDLKKEIYTRIVAKKLKKKKKKKEKTTTKSKLVLCPLGGATPLVTINNTMGEEDRTLHRLYLIFTGGSSYSPPRF